MRSLGGVSITLMSRKPSSDMCKVRGMGVADMVSTSTSLRSCFSRSLWRTPKRCSSSTMTSPRSLNLRSFDRTRWVPMTMSTWPASILAIGFLLLLGGAEAAEHVDLDGKGREALPEGVVVLERKHRGRRQHCDLAIVADRFECRAHRDFRLAVTDIAAKQAVHGRGGLHVALDVNNRVHLVFGFVELEGVFELVLPFGVGGKSMSLGGLAHRVELEQLFGHVLHGLFHAGFGLLPLLRAQPIQYRLHSFRGAVLLHQVQPGKWYIQACALGVFQDHELGRAAVFLGNLLQSLVLANAVLDVHHVIADGEIAEIGQERRDFGLLPLRMRQRDLRLVEQIARPEEDQVRLRQGDSFGHVSLHDGCGFYVFREVRRLVHVHFAARLGSAAADAERQVVFVEDVGQALDLAGAGDGEDDSLAFPREASNFFGHGGDRAVKASRGLGLQREMFFVAGHALDSQLLDRDDGRVLQALAATVSA